jgi:uncharacterized membrane protein (DUF373 family)
MPSAERRRRASALRRPAELFGPEPEGAMLEGSRRVQAGPHADRAAPAVDVRRPWREWISRGFSRVEDAVYVGLGVLLAGSALVLLGASAVDFWQGLMDGTLPQDVVALRDRLLLILMIVEILYTVQVSFREHTLVAEPFLSVGLIAAIRRILVLTAEFSRLLEMGEMAFRNAMLELGLLTAMVVALVASLHLLRRPPAGPTAPRS